MRSVYAVISLVLISSCAQIPKPEPTPQTPPSISPLPSISNPSPPPTTATAPTLLFAPTPFAEIPAWGNLDVTAARTAFVGSCNARRAQPETAFLSASAPYAGRKSDWQTVCRLATERAVGDQDFFLRYFQPWAVSSPAGNSGRLTSYYEPELSVSRQRTLEYDTPIQGRPADLVVEDLGLFDPSLAGRTLVGRVRNGAMEPYPTRADINEDAAPILAWGNASDVFFLQVQGSGRLIFPDGTQMRAAFAAHNGHPFRSIGAELIRRGALTRDQASADAIKNWMAKNGPTASRELINTNPRTVFFKLEAIQSSKEGPKGGQGVPLTAGASLAVDTTLHPYGLPIIVDADAPVLSATDAQRLIRRLVITQDTGGAILGPLRGDLFWGTGAAAGLQAGRVNHSARWWILLPLGLDPVVAGSSR